MAPRKVKRAIKLTPKKPEFVCTRNQCEELMRWYDKRVSYLICGCLHERGMWYTWCTQETPRRTKICRCLAIRLCMRDSTVINTKQHVYRFDIATISCALEDVDACVNCENKFVGESYSEQGMYFHILANWINQDPMSEYQLIVDQLPVYIKNEGRHRPPSPIASLVLLELHWKCNDSAWATLPWEIRHHIYNLCGVTNLDTTIAKWRNTLGIQLHLDSQLTRFLHHYPSVYDAFSNIIFASHPMESVFIDFNRPSRILMFRRLLQLIRQEKHDEFLAFVFEKLGELVEDCHVAETPHYAEGPLARLFWGEFKSPHILPLLDAAKRFIPAVEIHRDQLRDFYVMDKNRHYRQPNIEDFFVDYLPPKEMINELCQFSFLDVEQIMYSNVDLISRVPESYIRENLPERLPRKQITYAFMKNLVVMLSRGLCPPHYLVSFLRSDITGVTTLIIYILERLVLVDNPQRVLSYFPRYLSMKTLARLACQYISDIGESIRKKIGPCSETCRFTPQISDFLIAHWNCGKERDLDSVLSMTFRHSVDGQEQTYVLSEVLQRIRHRKIHPLAKFAKFALERLNLYKQRK